MSRKLLLTPGLCLLGIALIAAASPEATRPEEPPAEAEAVSPESTVSEEESVASEGDPAPPSGGPLQSGSPPADTILQGLKEGLYPHSVALILGAIVVAPLLAFLSQRLIRWYRQSRKPRTDGKAGGAEAAAESLDRVLPTLEDLARRLARAVEYLEQLAQTWGSRDRASEPRPDAGEPAQRPGVVSDEPHVGRRREYTAEGPLEAMRTLVEAEWRGRTDPEKLAAVARDLGLSLYEWVNLDDIHATTAPSLVDLRFEPWNPRSRRPVFVGWRIPGTGVLSVAPVSRWGFGSGSGFSALGKLFDFDPKPTDRMLEFHTLRRPCELTRRGEVYRLGRKGEVGTSPATDGPVAATGPGLLERGGVEPGPAPPTAVAPADDPMRNLIREELRRSLGSLPETLARVEAGQRESRADLARWESEFRKLREQLALRVAPAEQTTGRSVSTAPRSEAHARAPWEADAPPVEILPPPDRPPWPEAETLTAAAPSEMSSLAGPSPSTVRPNWRAFSWIQDALRASAAVTARPGVPGDYMGALVGLRSLLLEAAPTSLPEPRVDFAQVAMDAELFTLQPVRPEKGPHGEQFRKSDDGWVLADSIWQVFLRIAATAEEASAGMVALAFPWSRLEKGAPQLARNLVDAGGSGPLGEFVRCLVPAILERRGHLGGYAVVQKMIVAPIEAAPRSS